MGRAILPTYKGQVFKVEDKPLMFKATKMCGYGGGDKATKMWGFVLLHHNLINLLVDMHTLSCRNLDSEIRTCILES